MIHLHSFPSTSTQDAWTIYAPRIDTNVNVEWIAKYVHSEMRKNLLEKQSAFTIGFMPADWQPNDSESFDYNGCNYVVVTKDDINLLHTISEAIAIDDKHTLFVVPHYTAPMLKQEELMDPIVDAGRILFYISVTLMLIAWIYANFINK